MDGGVTMSVKFDVKMTEEYMCDFVLYHNYTRASGIMSVIIGAVAAGVSIRYILDGDMQYFCVWLFCAILLLIVNPYTMITRAKSQVRNTEMFQNTLEYELTETSVIVRQGEAEATTEWTEVTKVVQTRKSVILYLGRVRALIFPKKCMGDAYGDVIKLIRAQVLPKNIKIR